jgi:hypothetical protein
MQSLLTFHDNNQQTINQAPSTKHLTKTIDRVPEAHGLPNRPTIYSQRSAPCLFHLSKRFDFALTRLFLSKPQPQLLKACQAPLSWYRNKRKRYREFIPIGTIYFSSNLRRVAFPDPTRPQDNNQATFPNKNTSTDRVWITKPPTYHGQECKYNL